MDFFLAEIEGYNTSTSAVEILRFGTVPEGGLGYAPASPATDPYGNDHSNRLYVPRLIQPGKMRRDIFETGATGGASRVSYGEITIANADGAYDHLAEWAFAGRRFRVLMGQGKRPPYADLLPVLVGTLEQVMCDEQTFSFLVRDRQQDWQKLILRKNTYGGSNVGDNGVDGDSGLRDALKPLAMGRVFHWVPPCVNVAKQIYQYADPSGIAAGPDATVDVYEGGRPLPNGDNYYSQAAIEAEAPAAGYYRIWRGGGCFRINSSFGQYPMTITSTVFPAVIDKLGEFIKFLVVQAGGLTADEYVDGDFSSSLMDFQFGDLVEERDSLADVLDRLCGSVGAWWGFDRLSVFRVIELTPPSGVPVCTLSATEIISCTHSLTSDVDQGIPVSKIRVKYEQKRRLLTNEEVHPLSETSSAALTREYSEAELSNNTVIDAYPNAGTLEKVTQITGHYSDIGVYAARLRDIYTARRYRYDLKMRATASVLATVDLGAVVNVVYPRFGMSSGRLFRVIGIEFDLAARMIDLVLWR